MSVLFGPLAELGFDLVGVDLSQAALERAGRGWMTRGATAGPGRSP